MLYRLAFFLTVAITQALAKCPGDQPPDLPSWRYNPETENWIKNRVMRGLEAGLDSEPNGSHRFADPHNRVIRASVLEQLLLAPPNTDPRLASRGIVISCAIVVGPLNLRYADIKQPVKLQTVIFSGDVDLSWTHITKSLHLDGSVFLRDVSLNTARLDQALFLTKAVFNGDSDFTAMEVSGALVADGVEFMNNNCGHPDNRNTMASFNSAKVGNTMFLSKATFGDCVVADFAHMRVGLDFKSTDATVYSSMPLDMTHMTAHRIQLQHANIRNALKLNEVSADEVEVEDPVAGPVSIDLSEGNVRTHLSLRGLHLVDLLAPRLRAEGTVDMIDLRIEHWMDFHSAVFGSCTFKQVIPPKDRWNAWFDGVTYDYIRVTDDDSRDNFKTLLGWPRKLRFSASVYSALEAFLRDQGYSEASRKAAVSERRDERDPNEPLDWLGSLALDWLIGYGNYPFRAIWACMIVVAVGTMIFRDRNQMVQNPDKASPGAYSPFWYSLGLFLPVVDLEMSKRWRPCEKRRFAVHYVRIHMLLGWILIPLFAAGLTGLVK